jgi:hypothetical protein
MEIRENNIVFLIGAGCSKAAGIPVSVDMVRSVEELLENDSEWKKYTTLYNYLRSSIEYSEGIFGNFRNAFNIERLLIIMNEIEKRDRNIIYPFIGSWNLRLSDVAGQNFDKITALKRLIKDKLLDWTNPKGLTNKVEYYKGFAKLHSEIGYTPLRIFSLNYDLCFEKAIEENVDVEQGFDPKTNEWQYSNFEDIKKPFCLYKLHGSINWYTDKHTGRLMLSNHPVTNPELIFGIDTKLKSTDPYFFYTSEFRKWLLHKDCKLIVTIGYSFADDYINDLISQSIINDNQKQLLVIMPEKNIDRRKEIISKQLHFTFEYNKHCCDRINIHDKTAEEFLSNEMTADFFVQRNYISNDNDSPFS